MNISTQDMETIRGTAERFGVSAVYLFGSSLASEGQPRDIDLAVEGVPPGAFFKFYGVLLRALSRDVDVVDLAIDSPVTRLTARDAVKIYG